MMMYDLGLTDVCRHFSNTKIATKISCFFSSDNWVTFQCCRLKYSFHSNCLYWTMTSYTPHNDILYTTTVLPMKRCMLIAYLMICPQWYKPMHSNTTKRDKCHFCLLFIKGLGLWYLTPLLTIFQLYFWQSVLLVDETWENHIAVVSSWQILSYNVVSSTPRHERD